MATETTLVILAVVGIVLFLLFVAAIRLIPAALSDDRPESARIAGTETGDVTGLEPIPETGTADPATEHPAGEGLPEDRLQAERT